MANKKMKLIMYLYFVLFCCCTNTNNRKDSKEDFYTRTSGWDYMRIPLIKPFEVTCTDNVQWIVDTKIPQTTIQNIQGPSDVKRVGVYPPYILLYCKGEPIVSGQPVKEAWFIINANENRIYGFKTQKDFLLFASDCRLSNLKTFDVNNIWQSFSNGKALPWTKNIDKYKQ